MAAKLETGKEVGTIPRHVLPQLASFSKVFPEGPGWSYERKYDGHRLQVVVQKGRTRLFSRSGLDWTDKFPGLVTQLATIPADSVTLDGEVCVVTEGGHTNLGLLARAAFRQSDAVTFFVFDILERDGMCLTNLPLRERREILRATLIALGPNASVKQVESVERGGRELLELMRLQQHEGIVAKHADSVYRPGMRTRDWIKIKCRSTATFSILGAMVDDSRQIVTSLVVASPTAGGPRYAGRVGSGLSDNFRSQLFLRLTDKAKRFTKAPSVDSLPSSVGRRMRWLPSPINAEIQYLEMSARGILREPSFLHGSGGISSACDFLCGASE